ncbi:tRNA lysidine(34) synthetase TilS [Shewanella sp. AS16]|uniref:tRNA lysidine(34) synthetase TilS n=1 Tax=Shewanella sp. AS16 TaxID=2907625 RepID=UPI002278395A
MIDVAGRIEAQLQTLSLPATAKLVLAYSGGVDSEVLAHGLSLYAKRHPQRQVLLVHVHHGLSANADAWSRHCQASADAYGLTLKVQRVKVRQGPRLSLEAEARSARYRAILALMQTGDLLLTAHHEDDQLETILLALKRGQGPKGLAAMGASQPLDGDKWQLRPLLDVSREQIEAYAQRHQLAHIEDESNADDKFDRNFLRLEIIPRLKARWGAIASTASRSAALCAEQQAVVDEEVSKRLPEWIDEAVPHAGSALRLTGFASLSPAWQALLLRGYIDRLGLKPPSQLQLEQIRRQLLHAREDARVEIRVSGLLVRRFQTKAYISAATEEAPASQRVLTSAEMAELLAGKTLQLSLANSCGLRLCLTGTGPRLRLPAAGEPVTVRFNQGGSLRCHPQQRAKGRELKKLWQEFGIPPWKRAGWPLLFYGDKLVAAVGLWLEKSAVCEAETPGLSCVLEGDPL